MKNEWVIILIIFILLFMKLGKMMKNESLLNIIYILLTLNFLQSFWGLQNGWDLFDGMFSISPLINFQKTILNLAVLLIAFINHDWLKKHEHLPEFFMLTLSALLGMFLLISSGNLLIFFLSLELATIPVAALANFDLHKKQSSEAAMKMILISAFSSGILLFGISLVYGSTGTIQFGELSERLNNSPLQIISFVFLFTAFAFKLSIVPFHLWTADVYEGGPVATSSFLSVVSKGAIAFIFMSALYKVFSNMQHVWYNMLVILSVATLLIGNLFALRQNNLKRFLAFSSIAQVGFILVGISASSELGTASVTYFVLIYVFSNLAAFGVVSIISSATERESIEDFKGLYQNNKLLSWVMALAMFSLAGIPPTAGFFGKMFLIMAGGTKATIPFIVIVVLNLVISLYYYLRVVRAIFMDKNENPIEKVKPGGIATFGLIICSIGIVVTGLIGWIYEYIKSLL